MRRTRTTGLEVSSGVAAIDDFIGILSRGPSPNELVFNPWRDTDDRDASPRRDMPAQRRENMAAYLEARRDSARVLLLGEAPSHRGCRFTGIAFCSETELVTKGGLVARRPLALTSAGANVKPQRERSAAVIWGEIERAGKPFEVVLWNAFPWHPYSSGDRRPERIDQSQAAPGRSHAGQGGLRSDARSASRASWRSSPSARSRRTRSSDGAASNAPATSAIRPRAARRSSASSSAGSSCLVYSSTDARRNRYAGPAARSGEARAQLRAHARARARHGHDAAPAREDRQVHRGHAHRARARRRARSPSPRCARPTSSSTMGFNDILYAVGMVPAKVRARGGAGKARREGERDRRQRRGGAGAW